MKTLNTTIIISLMAGGYLWWQPHGSPGFDGWIQLIREQFETEDQAIDGEKTRLRAIGQGKRQHLEAIGVQVNMLHLSFDCGIVYSPPETGEECVWAIDHFKERMLEYVASDEELAERLLQHQLAVHGIELHENVGTTIRQYLPAAAEIGNCAFDDCRQELDMMKKSVGSGHARREATVLQPEENRRADPCQVPHLANRSPSDRASSANGMLDYQSPDMSPPFYVASTDTAHAPVLADPAIVTYSLAVVAKRSPIRSNCGAINSLRCSAATPRALRAVAYAAEEASAAAALRLERAWRVQISSRFEPLLEEGVSVREPQQCAVVVAATGLVSYSDVRAPPASPPPQPPTSYFDMVAKRVAALEASGQWREASELLSEALIQCKTYDDRRIREAAARRLQWQARRRHARRCRCAIVRLQAMQRGRWVRSELSRRKLSPIDLGVLWPEVIGGTFIIHLRVSPTSEDKHARHAAEARAAAMAAAPMELSTANAEVLACGGIEAREALAIFELRNRRVSWAVRPFDLATASTAGADVNMPGRILRADAPGTDFSFDKDGSVRSIHDTDVDCVSRACETAEEGGIISAGTYRESFQLGEAFESTACRLRRQALQRGLTAAIQVEARQLGTAIAGSNATAPEEAAISNAHAARAKAHHAHFASRMRKEQTAAAIEEALRSHLPAPCPFEATQGGADPLASTEDADAFAALASIAAEQPAAPSVASTSVSALAHPASLCCANSECGSRDGVNRAATPWLRSLDAFRKPGRSPLHATVSLGERQRRDVHASAYVGSRRGAWLRAAMPFKPHATQLLLVRLRGYGREWSVQLPYRAFLVVDQMLRGAAEPAAEPPLLWLPALPPPSSAGVLTPSTSKHAARVAALQQWLLAVLQAVRSGALRSHAPLAMLLELHMPLLLELQARARAWVHRDESGDDGRRTSRAENLGNSCEAGHLLTQARAARAGHAAHAGDDHCHEAFTRQLERTEARD